MNIEEPVTAESAEKCPFLEYVENNPVAAVVQALAIGFAVGMVVRLIEGPRRREAEIDVKRKPTLDEAKFHLGSLRSPPSSGRRGKKRRKATANPRRRSARPWRRSKPPT